MRNINSMLRFLLGCIIFIIMVSFSFKKMDTMHCTTENINIDNTDFITEYLVIDFLKDNSLFPDNLTFSNISFQNIESSLYNHDHIDKVKVYSDILGNIQIDIIPKEPIIRVIKDNDSFYLDDTGERMEVSSFYTARLPIVSGDINAIDQEDLFVISDYIYNDDFLKKYIVQIEISEDRLFLFTRSGNIKKIEFGRIENIEDKFKKLRKYFEHMRFHDREYDTINLEYRDQILCKKTYNYEKYK